MKTMLLNGTWSLRGRPQEGPGQELVLDAAVPGCVQLDLSKAGYLPEDLYMGNNILETEQYEGWEWWYERTFTAPAERENVWLVFEGVDCLATYFLNGEKIGESENMLIAHSFEVGRFLKDGENTLTVHLKSPVIAAHYENYATKALSTWEDAPVQTAVRKAPHSFGWDIMPRAVTSGLWRDVKLEVRDRVYFSQLYFATTGTTCKMLYELQSKWVDFRNIEIEVKGGCGDSTIYQRKKLLSGKAGSMFLKIDNPKQWWPYGYGEANVYDVTVSIYADGEPVHAEQAQFGLRDVVLDRTDSTDGNNGRFRFLINGVEIMCKGSNWVPMDVFHSRDAERYDKAFELVKDIGCNILRCWGGNVYEDHAFYDFCDRNGVMVWQDFTMACRVYPENSRFETLLKQEAEAVVRKLRNHPCIILWAGDNEIDLVMENMPSRDPSTNRTTREFLPSVLQQNDFTRPYLPSSPYLSEEVYRNKGRLFPPEDHLWGNRDYFKSSYYTASPAHFVSEVGYHGCPSMDSVKKFITPEKVWPYHNNDEWILHSTNQRGEDARVMLMHKQVRQLFGEIPTDPDRYALASQISQAEADKFFIERMRVDRPRKTGVIWWNLLDGWPQMSDAVVDYYYEKKLAYHYIKRCQAPFTIAAGELDNWDLKLYACNDTLTEKSGTFTVKDALTDEVLLDSPFAAAVNTTTCIGKIPLFYSEHRFLIMEWTANGEKGCNHYVCGFPPLSLSDYERFLENYPLGGAPV